MTDDGVQHDEQGLDHEIADIGDLVDLAGRVAARLAARGETVAVCESSAGGLIAAALLASPGASAYFVGGVVVYTAIARQAFLGIDETAMTGIRSATETYAALLARVVRVRLASDWALAETGAAGPAGNRHGDAAGHVCLAVAGPSATVRTLETGSSDRLENMRVFAKAALKMLHDALERA